MRLCSGKMRHKLRGKGTKFCFVDIVGLKKTVNMIASKYVSFKYENVFFTVVSDFNFTDNDRQAIFSIIIFCIHPNI